MPKKPGPKTERGAEPMSPRTLSLDDLTWRKLLVVGEGNASKGVRLGADLAYERYQLSAVRPNV